MPEISPHPAGLRTATAADSEAVKAVVFTALREHGLQPDPGQTDADLDDIDAEYFQRGGRFSVLEAPGGVIIGTVGIRPVSPGVCELRKMYLDSRWRGRGLGRMLLDHGLAEARRLGFNRVVLETASVLKEAIRLYERYGFRPYKPEHLVPRCDQAYFLDLK